MNPTEDFAIEVIHVMLHVTKSAIQIQYNTHSSMHCPCTEGMVYKRKIASVPFVVQCMPGHQSVGVHSALMSVNSNLYTCQQMHQCV